MAIDHERLLGVLMRLKLPAIRDQLGTLLDEAARRELSLREALATAGWCQEATSISPAWGGLVFRPAALCANRSRSRPSKVAS
jgi:hypothetical protein